MTAHISVPSLDDRKNRASSLSDKVIAELLQEKMGFRGLVISDALNMKGVANYFKPGRLEVEALLAGNDILLFPEDVPTAVRAINAALKDGTLTQQVLDTRVKKILKAKYWVGLDKYKPISKFNLLDALKNSEKEYLKEELVSAGLTLATNTNHVVPLQNLDTLKIAALSIGASNHTPFQNTLSLYGDVDHFTISNVANDKAWHSMHARLKSYDLVITAIHKINKYRGRYGVSAVTTKNLTELEKKHTVVHTLFGNPYALKYIGKRSTVLVAYEDNTTTHEKAAQAIFGALEINGVLPVTASSDYKYGQGYKIANPVRIEYTRPEAVGIKTSDLNGIDRLAREAMNAKAIPGCQVMVAVKGKVIYNKSFGYHTYDRKQRVRHNDLYDLASITKVAATTVSLMRMEDKGILKLDNTVSDYLPKSLKYPYRNMTLRNIVLHQAGLKSWIPFYKYAIDSPNYSYNFREKESDTHSIEVADDLYMNESFVDSMWRRIGEAKVGGNRYVYSDLGMYISKEIVEEVNREGLDEYAGDEFFEPLGLATMTFNPLEKFDKKRTVPTEKDKYFRNQIVQGYVHDMGAAMLGGVSGHAGLFSSANDLVVLFQMLMNGGYYGGREYLKAETVKRWTTKQGKNSRRALGFDKPDHGASSGGPTAPGCSNATFGHTGFTGTCVWADPVHEVIFVFLSNRTYPTMENRKLIRMSTRTKMQQVVYDALNKRYTSSIN